MREIKFRAWDITDKKWIDGGLVNILYEYDHDPQFVILQQSTGLKDVTGKEIFEGDIVEAVNCGEDSGIYEIRHNAKEARYFLHPNKSSLWHCGFDQGEIDALNLEVIGNIFENPELLS